MFSAATQPHVTREFCDALQREGYVVVDNFMGGDLADALRAELLGLNEAGLLSPNTTQFGKRTFAKPHVYEADLHRPELRALFPTQLPHFAAWCDESAAEFAVTLRDTLPQLRLCVGDSARAVKLQLNTGHGGCFPWHYDNPGPPNKRAVTLLVYLNPRWRPGDGGELVLNPFLEKPVTVAPFHDRGVFFLSDRVVHRVLPNHAERLMMTTWFDGGAVNAQNEVTLSLPPAALADVPATARGLRQTGCQRAVSRAVYAEEYEQSLVECMSDVDDGLQALVAAHRQHLAAVDGNPPLRRLVDALRQLKPPAP
jgi:Rps23 Pro-64 3,4-dihydroxylase Tpa1-like proline 4-hydroxylase